MESPTSQPESQTPDQSIMTPTMGSLGPSPPAPVCALPLLARAHILLRTRADLSTEIKYGAIAVCGIMIYGTCAWQLALRNAASTLQDEEDEEDGMVLVDFSEGRGMVSSRDMECLDDDDSSSDTAVADEIGVLVEKAIAEIKKWDREMGKRVEAVLGELQMLCGPGAL